MFHVRGSSFPLRSLSLYAPFPNDSMTSYGPSRLGPSLPPSSAWLASFLWRSKFIFKASSFFIKFTSAVRSVGMPISAGMTASVSYVSKNGVSPLLDLFPGTSSFFYAKLLRCPECWHAYFAWTCESSPIQSLLLSSNRALIPYPKLLFALSTKPFVCGCFTEAKHWQIHSFSHQSLNGLSRNCFPLSDTISPGRPNLQTMLSHARDSRYRLCLDPFGKVVNGYNQELDFAWTFREGSGSVDPPFVEFPRRCNRG
ncbi:hypothetical protein Tco_0400170 [Tanacetum coccineum]